MKLVVNPGRALLLGTALALLPAPAMAQDANTADNTVVTDPLGNETVTTDTTYTNTPTTDEREEEDNDFPWGLLGLAGLAGLLGRKRDTRDVHVDARHDTRK